MEAEKKENITVPDNADINNIKNINNIKKLWENAKGHLKTINEHKRLVMEHCFRVGLYKQGLLHDLSKYSPAEFITGIKYYQGDKSPNAAEREEKGKSEAWLHHKGRNKHHYEYWIDYPGRGQDIAGMEMPVRYVVEMFCDRVAACKVYNKEKYTDSDALNYYKKGRAHYVIHPKSDRLLKYMLEMLSAKGEEYTFDYIRRKILKNKKRKKDDDTK